MERSCPTAGRAHKEVPLQGTNERMWAWGQVGLGTRTDWGQREEILAEASVLRCEQSDSVPCLGHVTEGLREEGPAWLAQGAKLPCVRGGRDRVSRGPRVARTSSLRALSLGDFMLGVVAVGPTQLFACIL